MAHKRAMPIDEPSHGTSCSPVVTYLTNLITVTCMNKPNNPCFLWLSFRIYLENKGFQLFPYENYYLSRRLEHKWVSSNQCRGNFWHCKIYWIIKWGNGQNHSQWNLKKNGFDIAQIIHHVHNLTRKTDIKWPLGRTLY